MAKSYKKWFLACFISMLLIYCFHYVISQEIDYVTYSDGRLKIQDYAYHIIIVKKFWFDGFGNIYKLAFQQQALSAYIGSQIYKVMPLGITPLSLILWLPFAYVARLSMPLSYTLWSAFSIGVLLIALWNVSRYAFNLKKLNLLPITLILVTILSATTFRTLHLGQTSVIASGLLIHLISIVNKKAGQPKSSSWLFISILIFVLGIKPPYIVLGLGLLMIYGMWKELLYSVAILLFILIGITPLLTIKWVPSYFNLLQMYSRGDIPDVYAWSITPETMNIFRSVFRNFIGDNIAALISNMVTYSVYIGVAGLSILSKIRGKSIEQLSQLKVTKEQLFILLVSNYLLFAPYAGAYEDILLLPIFIMVLYIGNTPNLTNYKSFALIFALFFILLHNYFPQDKPLWLFWILKAVILGYILNFCRLPLEGKKSAVLNSN